MIKVFIDFEFNKIREKKLNLVCAVMTIQEDKETWTNKYWLHKDKKAQSELKEAIETLHKRGAIFFAFMASAEARSMLALDIDVVKLKWIDLCLEYRCLTNQNYELSYGRQLINGAVRTTKPPVPKWAATEEERKAADSSKPQHSLASCTFKLLGIKIDTERKDKMRDLIISSPRFFSDSEKEEILEYCASDVENLPKILSKILGHYKKRLSSNHLSPLPKEMLLRGEYAARTAVMENHGYPIKREWVEKFVAALPEMIKSLQEDINSQFKLKPFKWNNRQQRYSMNMTVIRSWVKKYCDDRNIKWLKTKTGLLSISHDAFEDKFHFRHDYPRNNFGAQILRFFKFRQSLNGFLPKGKDAKNKEVFLDYVGTDDFCRPYFGTYGAQSSRSQPKATSYIPLKAAWMRSFIQPPSGHVVCGIDYSSQEFLLGGLVSKDITMIKAYKSGDPYLFLAIQAGAAPLGATKKSHGKIREPFKSTELGVGYGMQSVSLADKLTQDTGVVHTVEEAESLIRQREEIYWKNTEWRSLNLAEYRENGHIKLPCGWYMWGDNINDRSVNNVVIQGFAASILRKAVALAQDRGVNVIYTLHDAIYIMSKKENAKKEIDILWDAMHEAFCFYFKDKAKKYAALIRLEGDVWGPELEEGEFTTLKNRKLKSQRIYIDERGRKEYEMFSRYFTSKDNKHEKQKSKIQR